MQDICGQHSANEDTLRADAEAASHFRLSAKFICLEGYSEMRARAICKMDKPIGNLNATDQPFPQN